MTKRNSDQNTHISSKKYKIANDGRITIDYQIELDNNEMKCVICYDYMLEKIYRCKTNFHYICNECFNSIDSKDNNYDQRCPICRNNVLSTNKVYF